jgi:hypothetical protein
LSFSLGETFMPRIAPLAPVLVSARLELSGGLGCDSTATFAEVVAARHLIHP